MAIKAPQFTIRHHSKEDFFFTLEPIGLASADAYATEGDPYYDSDVVQTKVTMSSPGFTPFSMEFPVTLREFAQLKEALQAFVAESGSSRQEARFGLGHSRGPLFLDLAFTKSFDEDIGQMTSSVGMKFGMATQGGEYEGWMPLLEGDASKFVSEVEAILEWFKKPKPNA